MPPGHGSGGFFCHLATAVADFCAGESRMPAHRDWHPSPASSQPEPSELQPEPSESQTEPSESQSEPSESQPEPSESQQHGTQRAWPGRAGPETDSEAA